MPVLAATVTYASFYLNATSTSYTVVHDAASAQSMGAAPTIGQWLDGAVYKVYRSGVFFDTSSIPSDAAVISAILSFYGAFDNSTTDFNLTIVNGSALSNPRLDSDYGGLLAATASAGSINTSTWSLTAYNDITLNATGLGFITKAGTTKLALKSSRDISSTTPTGEEFVEADGIAGGNPPKLAVYYMKRGNLFVKAENLHYVSDTGVERYIPGIAV